LQGFSDVRNGSQRILLLAQGGYYAVTGVWPLIHIDSFQKVTGPKTDLWLVKTVGALVAVMGGVMVTGALREQPVREVKALAAGAAAVLTAIDTVYPVKRRISAIYLIDAAVELALTAAWVVTRVHTLPDRFSHLSHRHSLPYEPVGRASARAL
jgi:hypothetical protein